MKSEYIGAARGANWCIISSKAEENPADVTTFAESKHGGTWVFPVMFDQKDWSTNPKRNQAGTAWLYLLRRA